MSFAEDQRAREMHGRRGRLCLGGARRGPLRRRRGFHFVPPMIRHLRVMEVQDDELRRFEAEGARPLPDHGDLGVVIHEGARIWYAAYGAGPPVILLHGGLGHSGNWGYQVSAFVDQGRRVVVIDSRGHGRSTRDERPYSYDLMAADVLAVMDALSLKRPALVGWSDGATISLLLALREPARVAGVFFFACNMDPSGVRPFEATSALKRCFARHGLDYAALSTTPKGFEGFVDAVSLMMNTQHKTSAAELAAIRVPVVVAQSASDEFIKLEHAEYLARTIPGAELLVLEGVTHFAPLQRPGVFNAAVLAFLDRVLPAHSPADS
jgi:pimeloyl-ACP methyl ester carboxylesterase